MKPAKDDPTIAVAWDFELENDFRGPSTLPNREAARELVSRIAKIYDRARIRETQAAGLTQALAKFDKIATRADRLLRAIKILTVDEYRLLHIGADTEGDPARAQRFENFRSLKESLFPDDWQGTGSERKPSGLSVQTERIARYFEQVRFALAEKHGFSAEYADPGGKTKSVHLLVSSARWRLVHVSWQAFAALPGVSPSGGNVSDFHYFLQLIHEAVTTKPGNFMRELAGDAGHYVQLRRSFDKQQEILRRLGSRYGWSNFQELEDVINGARHPTVRLTPRLCASIQLQMEQYISDREALLLGRRFAPKPQRADQA